MSSNGKDPNHNRNNYRSTVANEDDNLMIGDNKPTKSSSGQQQKFTISKINFHQEALQTKINSHTVQLPQTPEVDTITQDTISAKSDKCDYENYVLNLWTKFQTAQKCSQGLAAELSFISHVLATDLLYSKPVSMKYNSYEKQCLSTGGKVHEGRFDLKERIIRIADLIDKDTPDQASMLLVTRLINSHFQSVVTEIKNPKDGFDYYNSVASFGANVDETVDVSSNHYVSGKNNTREHITLINPNDAWGLAYNDVTNILNFLDNKLGDLKTADLIREILKNDFTNIFNNKSLTKDEVHRLVSITYLLFVCEPSRNPAAFIHHQMLLDLKIGNHITWNEMFLYKIPVYLKKMKRVIFLANTPLMPMRPVDSIMRARRLNQLYKEYLRIEYQYDDREGDKVPGVLVRSEAEVVKKWLEKVKKGSVTNVDSTSILDVIRFIKGSIWSWYGIDLSNNKEEYDYPESQIVRLLERDIHDDSIQTLRKIENLDLFGELASLAPVVIPMKPNYWTGLLIREQVDGKIQSIYVDPFNTLEDEPNYSGMKIKEIRDREKENFVVLKPLDFLEGDDCGPSVIQNLKWLYKAGNLLDNKKAEEIVTLMKSSLCL